MSDRRWSWAFGLLVCLGMSPALGANEVAVTPRIERVALFKNGRAFLTSRVALPEGATTAVLGRLPVPSYGTFWIASPDGFRVKEVVTSLEDVSREVPLVQPAELLQANLGRTVRLADFGAEHDVSGKLLDVLEEDPEAPGSPYVMGGAPPSPSLPERNPGTLALIETSDGVLAIRVNRLTRVSFPEGMPRTTGTRTSKEAVVRVELEKPARGEVLTLTYLAGGMSWAPSYRIDLSDADTAQLSASAEVINEVVDLEGVELELVTGYPKIDFAGVSSPIARSQTLAEFLRALQARVRGGSGSGQQVMMQALAEEARAGGPSYGPPIEGWAAEDLFLYPVGSRSLRRGEVALLPLFTAGVPYEHVYTWDVPDFLDANGRFRPRDDERTSKEVWHVCRLTNRTGMPLTTAPAEFVRDGRIVGQGLARYCNEGATRDIRINRALGIVADHSEVEASRAVRAFTATNGLTYDKVGVEGELGARSSLGQPAKVEVTKRITGELVEASDEPQVTRTARGLRGVNPTHELKWTFVLAPGEEKRLRYEYTVLVR
jgi:hypothetical protein